VWVEVVAAQKSRAGWRTLVVRQNGKRQRCRMATQSLP